MQRGTSEKGVFIVILQAIDQLKPFLEIVYRNGQLQRINEDIQQRLRLLLRKLQNMQRSEKKSLEDNTQRRVDERECSPTKTMITSRVGEFLKSDLKLCI